MATLDNRLKALEDKNPTGVSRFKKRTDAEQYEAFGQGLEGFDLKAIKGKTFDEKYSRVVQSCISDGEPLAPKESDAVKGFIEWLTEYMANINDPDVMYDLGDGKYARRSEGWT